MREKKSFWREEIRSIAIHWTIGALLVIFYGSNGEDLIEQLLERALHFDAPTWVWQLIGAATGVLGVAYIAWGFFNVPYLLLRRRLIWKLVCLRASVFQRDIALETRIRYTREPKLLRAILLKAMGDDVLNEGLSPLSIFRKWTALDHTIYRVWENVAILDPNDRERRQVARGDAKAFYSIFPLKEAAFNDLVSNDLHYDALDENHMVDLRMLSGNPEPVWLFVLDFEMIRENVNVVATYLSVDLLTKMTRLILKNPSIAGFAALAATEAGEAFIRGWGLTHYHYYQYSPKAEKPWKLFHMPRDELLALIRSMNGATLESLNRTVQPQYIVDENVRAVMKQAFREFRRKHPLAD